MRFEERNTLAGFDSRRSDKRVEFDEGSGNFGSVTDRIPLKFPFFVPPKCTLRSRRMGTRGRGVLDFTGGGAVITGGFATGITETRIVLPYTLPRIVASGRLHPVLRRRAGEMLRLDVGPEVGASRAEYGGSASGTER